MERFQLRQVFDHVLDDTNVLPRGSAAALRNDKPFIKTQVMAAQMSSGCAAASWKDDTKKNQEKT